MVAVVLSCAWYVPRLGFSSDDWAFLAHYVNASDQTVSGLYAASFREHDAMRPLQLWMCAALYRVFGTQPLGYHAFNSVLLIANAILLYAVLQQLAVARIVALPVALVYAVLPSYSTDRYWFVAFPITFSMTACLASIYADLNAARAPGLRSVAWKALSAAALIASALAYEVALPLFLLVPWLLLWQLRHQPAAVTRKRLMHVAVLVLITGVLIAAVVAFKLQTTVRLGAQHGIARQVVEIARHALQRNLPYGHYGLNVFSAAGVHFGEYGLMLPRSTLAVARTARPGVLWLTGVFGLVTCAYLVEAGRRERWASMFEWIVLLAAGLMVFGLGYAIFLTNYNVQFTSTGIANRSAIAAAVGAAMCTVACIGIVMTLLPLPRVAPVVFAGAIAAVATCDVLIVNAVAQHWARAYDAARSTLTEVRQHFPSLPPKTTLILDGVCPYVGPAVVFEANWDLAGALRMLYRDNTLLADVVTPRLVVGDTGITTTIYGEKTTYRYGSRVVVYRAGDGVAYPLHDAAAARAYFANSRHAQSCPRGQEGVGVRLF